ncbi:glycerol kinase GlpK [Mycobacterium cookii]|uniref:Glycerol kinase n=1 Tax=Nocardioides furvisabuli TaxID=375542 RepID=A0ABP5JFD7_9ACTN|nr:glycerol kinase GlpK [Nocardioides furvisabuli]
MPGDGYVCSIDQGTTSTRCIVVDRAGREVSRAQVEHEQVMPRQGWVEHDPVEIWNATQHVVVKALASAGIDASALAALGIANQRETTVVWNPRTGQPWCNAIVWQDLRTDKIAAAIEADGRGEVIRHRTGLPPATYFSAGKMQWILENVDGVRDATQRGEALFGTIETWLLWNLSGGVDGGIHVTDVTNASRTMLMELESLDWDEELLAFFDIPRSILPEIRPSSDRRLYGRGHPAGPLPGVPLAAALGDQQAAMVGQLCLSPGDAKSTYGTGSFLLLNTGDRPVRSHNGLLTTVCYQLGDAPPVYALEGSTAVTGAAVQWLRDQLGIVGDAAEVEQLAASVPDNGGVHFVPAFSGLFAPYWRSDARGAIVGLSRFNTRAHLARATLEAIAFQTRDVADAMVKDSGVALEVLRVDGGVTANDLCMQIQADVLGVPVSRPVFTETTALGAAYAAGLAVGFWGDVSDLHGSWEEGRRWHPEWDPERRATAHARWQKAVARTLDWVDLDEDE